LAARRNPGRGVAALTAALVVGASGLISAAPAHGGPPTGSGAPPAVAGRGEVAPPRPARPAPLPRPSKTTPIPLRAGAAASAAAPTDKVALRALVLAVDEQDFGLPTWRTVLDRVGVPYDVVTTRTTPLTAGSLVRPDGVGRYNAVLLTSASLLHPDGAGGYVSGLDADEWHRLWAYERDYAVRQVSLYTAPGTWPEDYCLRPVGEGGVGDAPLHASLTAAAAPIFDYLRSTARIPITQSYVYRVSVAPGCAAQPLLTAGRDVLGVTSTSADGRQRAALTFSSNQYLLQADLLTYGLLRWATRGLFFGQHRHYLNADVDDWFNSADHYYPDGRIESDPGYRVAAREMVNLNNQVTALRLRYPQAGAFRPALAYNGGGADLTARSLCSLGGPEQLTATSRCLRNSFRWINHTVNHPEMNHTDYATSRAEIEGNLTIAARLGLPVNRTVLKTGEYSGLGVYHPDPDNDVDPPIDFGLGVASNPALLRAAKDLGVRYLHGNMSFPSHVPSCLGCAVVHPMEPAVVVVPDWPTNIAYHTTTAAEQIAFYNSLYGPNGRFPYWPRNLTYEEMLAYEADVALRHMTGGSVYTHTFHIANVHDYGGGRTLLTDWVNAVLARFTAYYRVPVLSPDWPVLAAEAERRTGHAAAVAAGTEAVYDRTTNTVTVSSPVAGTVLVTGATTAGHSSYGTDTTAPVTLAAGGSFVFRPRLRA